MVMGVLLGGVADAKPGREPHRPHKPREPREPREPRGPRTPPTPPDEAERPTNVQLAPAGAVAIPGRGLTLAWSPDGRKIAVGGRFREKTTRLRYDTRIVDVAAEQVTKSFSCHYFWVVATAWADNPWLGEVLADGGGDHAVKLWDAQGRGSTSCNPGQMKTDDGGIKQLQQINGWVTSLDFSPDGRWLAGVTRDRTVRVWQMEPGPDQFRVVALWHDRTAGNFLSVEWSPDGRALVTGDRKGRVAVWDLDLDTDKWDAATIAEFAKVTWGAQPSWFNANAERVTRTPRWSEAGHGVVWSVDWSPDGASVASTSTNGGVSVHDAATGERRFVAMAPRRTEFHSIAWHPDRHVIAAGASDDDIYVFDASTGEVADVLEGHEDTVSAVTWSPDGATLASTAGGPALSMALLESTVGPDMAVRLWRWRSQD
jgi:WD40 repeat protein